MIAYSALKEMALSLPDASEEPHFERQSFRIKKKIFATYDEKKHLLCVMLSPIEQSVFAYDPAIIYPVPNSWGKKGATYIELTKVKKSVVKDALKAAYDNVTKK